MSSVELYKSALVAFVPLHLLNLPVPEVPFAGCLGMDGVGLKWMEPKADS